MAGTDTAHDAHSGAHADPDDHGPAIVSGHDVHAQESLGPIDWAAWAAGLLGAAAAGIIAASLYLAAHAGS